MIATGPNLISWIPLVLGVAGMLGVAYAVFRSNLTATTIDSLKSTVMALQTEAKVASDHAERCERELTDTRDQLRHVSDLVTQAANVADVEQKVDRLLEAVNTLGGHG